MIDFLSTYAGLIGLIFFFSFFTGLLIWVYRPGAKSKYNSYGEIPLKEGQDV